MDILFQNYFDNLHQFVESFQIPNKNAYVHTCIVYIYAYRVILSSERNRNLFYHENQMSLWEQSKVPVAKRLHTSIAEDFHHVLDEDELLTNVYMDLGARRRLYREYTSGCEYLQHKDNFIYCHIKLIGLLCHLDMDTIKTNISAAFDFANAHVAPIASFLRNDD